MAADCLYCGLQLPATADFCPECGRLIERGFEIRPIQEPGFDHVCKQVKRKDDLRRQQGVYYDGNGPLTRLEEYAHPGNGSEREVGLAKRDRNTTASVEKIEPNVEENVEEGIPA